MLTTVLKKDNIKISGLYYTPDCEDENWNIIKQEAIHFIFNILVNWKLKDFGWSFFIEQQDDKIELQDFNEWNVIYSILSQLWYDLWKLNDDSDIGCFWHKLVNEWVTAIKN